MFNLNDIFTSSTPFLMLFSALGGCLIRYIGYYKQGKSFKIGMVLVDLLISAFLGYLTFWVLIQNTSFNMSLCAIATCIVGNLGAKIFDIAQYLIFNKLGYKSQENSE